MALHHDYGNLGEEIAAEYLKAKGYVIHQMHWRTGHKELDIVAETDGTLVVVEVKARRNSIFCKPEDVLSVNKMRRIVLAADAYVRYHRIDLPVRFDLITVVGDPRNPRITHYEKAFTSPVWYK